MWARNSMQVDNHFHILRDIRATYGDLTSPNYQKISELFNIGIDYKELNKLAYYFWIKDVTDCNEEYCFSFLIKNDDNIYRLELSLVGRYAVLLKIDGQDAALLSHEYITQDKSLRIGFADLLQSRVFLDRPTLEAHVELHSDDAGNDGRVPVYNALFASTSIPPWAAGQGSGFAN